jgi:hypothetical protein
MRAMRNPTIGTLAAERFLRQKSTGAESRTLVVGEGELGRRPVTVREKNRCAPIVPLVPVRQSNPLQQQQSRQSF